MKLAFWSVSTLDHSYLLQESVRSFRRLGMKEDYHVYSDRHIEGAINHKIETLALDSYFFKLDFLKKAAIDIQADWLVFLDADTQWIKPPAPDLLTYFTDNHFKSFSLFESDCSREANWHRWPISRYAALCRRLGVTSNVYVANGGFWAVHRDHVDVFCGAVQTFRRAAEGRLWRRLTEEPSLCYATMMLNGEKSDLMTIQKLPNWFTPGPITGGTWRWKPGFSAQEIEVSPAIVHCFSARQKAELVRRGKINPVSVSFFTSVMGRLHHLRQTLPTNTSENPNAEFCVLNYGSQDGLHEWVHEAMADHLASGQLVYAQVNADKWLPSHARNMCSRLCSNSILCQIDADSFCGPQFDQRLIDLFGSDMMQVARAWGGKIALPASVFHQIRGYDERITAWGTEDIDIVERACRAGLKYHHLRDGRWRRRIHHSDLERMEHSQIKDKHLSYLLSEEIRMKNNSEQVVQVNPHGYGMLTD